MAPSGRLSRLELDSVGHSTADPVLRALEVAIFVEESVPGLILPDSVLDAHHLGTPEAALHTVHHLTEER